MPRYKLRTLLIVLAIGPAIIWAITVGIANYLELRGPPEYKAARESDSQVPIRLSKKN